MICSKTEKGRLLYWTIIEFMYFRDDGKCCICGEPIEPEAATFEHTDLRSGGHRNDQPEYWRNGELVKNGVAHSICNSLKGSRREPSL